ncbi:MAG: PQQ-dependent sugar dehydrogenase, partial [Myxococcota bacterium]
MTKQVSDSISGAGVYRGSQPSDDALIHTGPEQRVRHQSGSTVGDGWTRHTKRTWQNRLNPRSPIRNTARSQFEGLVASHCQVPQQERALPDAVRNKPTLAFPVLQTRRYPELGVTVQTLAERLDIPWDVKFSNAGDAFFTERGGALSVFRAGAEGPEVLWRHSVGSGEGGMLGLALDPEFGEANQWIYV